MILTRRSLLSAPLLLQARTPPARFLRFDEVRHVLEQSSILAGPEIGTESAWDQWIRREDRNIRARVDRGVEDSITNLILFGTSFTKLPRVDNVERALAGGLAAARAHALMTGAPVSERIRLARTFVNQHALTESLLVSNIKRYAAEQRGYDERTRRASTPEQRIFEAATLYEHRGLSFDTSLLPNYAVADTLAALKAKKVIGESSIRDIAIIGPGLDFADKREGFDFYPLQTIQPFAVMDAILAESAGNPRRLVAFDLNSMVLDHVRGINGSYHIEVVNDGSEYSKRVFASIGEPDRAVSRLTRGVRIPARWTRQLETSDLDIVCQAGDGAFDLIVATNILVYYDRFRQALALASIGSLLNPGGIFISNTVLPAQRPPRLEFLGRRPVAYSAAYGDDIVVYRRKA